MKRSPLIKLLPEILDDRIVIQNFFGSVMMELKTKHTLNFVNEKQTSRNSCICLHLHEVSLTISGGVCPHETQQ